MADLSAADVVALKDNGRQDGFLEGNGIIILILFFLIFGLGGNIGGNSTQEAFNNQNVINKLDTMSTGLGQATWNINNAVMNAEADLQRCCCETNRNIDSVRYENAKNTCDIINNNTANTQKILDRMCQTEVDNLRNELQTAKFALSNVSQTSQIVDAVRPYPVMSVPFAPYGYNDYHKA